MLEEKKNIENEEIEIDLLLLLKKVKKSWKFIVTSAIIFAILAFLFTTFFMTKKYSSESTIYLTPKVTDQGTVDYSSVTSNTTLVNNYISILKGDNILSLVDEKIDKVDFSTIKQSVNASVDTDTQIIRVSAMTVDPILSKEIVEATVQVFNEEMLDKLNIQNLTVIDSAKANVNPVSPNIPKNTMIGAILGLILSIAYILLRYIFDKRLRNKEEAENFLGIPVLAEIPYYGE